MLNSIIAGHRVRLDFADSEHVFLGTAGGSVDVAVRPPTLWQTCRILLRPGLRAGESYMNGHWDITEGNLVTFLRIIQTPNPSIYSRLYQWVSDWRGPLFFLRQTIFTKNDRRNLSKHYDVGKEVYSRMLDESDQYSCAFFSLCANDDLSEAQQTKLSVSVTRLHIDRPRLRVLDIGCGWGALAAEIARLPGEHHVTGITLSEDQLIGANMRRGKLPENTAERLHYELADYREFLSRTGEQFDRIVSVGMFEHLGLGQHREFYKSIEKSLCSGGRALIHSIIRPSSGANNEWMQRYIFPRSFLPSTSELIAPAEKAGLILDAVHIHPPSDYRKTLEAWWQRFDRAWPDITAQHPGKYDDTFRRMWHFYLSATQVIFTEDLMNFRIAQIELRKR